MDKAYNGGKRNLSIKGRFMAVMTPLIAITLIACVWSSAFLMRRSVEGALRSSLTRTADLVATHIRDMLIDRMMIVDEIAGWIGRIGAENITSAELEDLRVRHNLVQVTLLDPSGKNQRGANASNAMYFTAPRDTRSSYISDVTYDESSSRYVLFASAPIITQGTFAGVLVCTVDAERLGELIADANIGENGHSFIINAEGRCVVHSDPDISLKDMTSIQDEVGQHASMVELWSAMSKGETGFIKYEYNDGLRMAAYRPANIPLLNWSVAATIQESEFMGDCDRSVLISLIISVVFFILTMLVMLEYANRLSRRIGVVSRRIEDLAKGDLASEVVLDGKTDEVGRLTMATATLRRDIQSIITDIKHMLGGIAQGDLTVSPQGTYVGDFAEIEATLKENIASLREITVSIRRASEEVARGSAQMASGAMGLSQGAAEQAGSIEELYSTISDIFDKASDISSGVAVYDAEDDDFEEKPPTPEEIEQKQDERAKTSMDRLILAMRRIQLMSNQIRRITYIIQSIASQTNILALNAAVEAAHAGEAGKGFAVIATEIRALASKSKDAVNTANEQTEMITVAVDKGNSIVNQTVEAVSSIVLALEQIKGALSQVSSVIENTAATAEETAAASEELSAQADLLRSTIAKFKLDDE